MAASDRNPLDFQHLCTLLKATLAEQEVPIDALQLSADLNQAGVQGITWQQALIDASSPSGLRGRALTTSAHELTELGQAGAIVVARGTDSWVTMVGTQASSCGADGRVRSIRSIAQCLPSAEPIPAVVLEMRSPPTVDSHDHPSPWQRLITLMRPEWPDIFTILIYSLVISLLTLATPVAVESLVNTVAFGRLIQPIVVLSLILFSFLAFSGVLRALQSFVAEIIQRRLFARVASDLAWRLPRADASAVESRNLPELLNRFFDVATVQKVVATFLLDGVGVVLSTLIGMAVLAFYHPWLLAFDLALLVAILFILTVLSIGAVKTSMKESKFKYATAGQLEEIARCGTLYKGSGGAELALQQVDEQVAGYLEARKKHFRVLLRQSLSALMLQALASTVLLALGGWLVISGQLTLGQLIAAELIVTVIVSSVAKFGKHLESFYDLMAAIDKLGYLFDVPVEQCRGAVSIPTDRPIELVLRGISEGGSELTLHAGQTLVLQGNPERITQFIDQLYALGPRESGSVQISGLDLRDIRPDLLRKDVALVRHAEILDRTLAENVTLGRSGISQEQLSQTLRIVGLEDRVRSLAQGIQTPLGIDGKPLTRTEAMRLCLARALAGSPQVLLIDGLLDGLSDVEISALISSSALSDPRRILIVATGRESLAATCELSITL